MDDRPDRPARPRRLALITLALAVATAGLTLRGLSPSLSPPGVTHVPGWYDALLGIAGGGGLTWAALRLWRRMRRDAAALGFALTGWALLAACVTLRSALFAQADYERGRLPFLAIATAILAAVAAVWARKRT